MPERVEVHIIQFGGRDRVVVSRLDEAGLKDAALGLRGMRTLRPACRSPRSLAGNSIGCRPRRCEGRASLSASMRGVSRCGVRQWRAATNWRVFGRRISVGGATGDSRTWATGGPASETSCCTHCRMLRFKS